MKDSTNDIVKNYLFCLNENKNYLCEFSIKNLLKKNNDKIKSYIKKFLKFGVNIFSLTIPVYLITLANYIARTPFEEIKRIKGIPYLNLEQFPEEFKVLYNNLKNDLSNAELKDLLLIGLISSLVFTHLIVKLKSDIKAKKEVQKLLKKNDKLDESKQKICKILIKNIYS